MGDIFLKLLNMSITASWLILAVLCIRFVFRNMPKWVHCILWGVVAIRLLIPFSIESEFSMQPSAQPIRTSTIVEGEVLANVPSIDSHLSIVEDKVNPMLVETFAYQESESMAPLQLITEIAGGIWLCGMIILFIFAVGSVIRLLLLVREAVPYQDNVYICDHVKSPFILGLINPRIYISSALSGKEIDFVLAHEKAHLRRKDHLWKPFGYLILCVYWFNPICWLAYILLCKDIELACDEKVIKDMSFESKKEYSRVLLSCATQRRWIYAYPLAFGEVGVKERVRTILKYKRPAILVTIAALVVCAVVALCFLTNPSKEYQIRITIPAGSTVDFCYSDEEISPKGNVLTLANGEGLGDTEVVLRPVEVKEENAYEPTYMTPGMPVKMDVEKGAWFKIGVNMQNTTAEDIDVYVSVKNVEIRIAAEDGLVNEHHEKEIALDVEMQDEMMPDMDEEGMYDELARVVSSVGLENAFPWNNTVTLKSDADALIKMANDESGRFEIYGIMSAKYGTYGILLNDWVGGQENWNFAYVPWIYSGASSEQPILEPNGKGKYIFAYIDKYEDGVPWWNECVLDCGYDTGHMELLSQDEYAKKYGEEQIEKNQEDYYAMVTYAPAEEVELFAAGVKEDVLLKDWESLSGKLSYPIQISGKVIQNAKEFLALDIDNKLNQEFVNAIDKESCREMFCNYQGIMMGETAQIWIASVDNGSGQWKLKVIALNGLMDQISLENVMDRVVSKVGLENAKGYGIGYFKFQEDALIKLCSSESGKYEAYGIISPEYGPRGILLNNIIDGEGNWNYFDIAWGYGKKDATLLETGEYEVLFTYYREDHSECELYFDTYETGTMSARAITQENIESEPQSKLPKVTRAEENVMIDTTEITGIVVINGNTGDRKTLTTKDSDSFGSSDLGSRQGEIQVGA